MIDPTVVVIPGILGSRLVHRPTHRQIWPGPLDSLIFEYPYMAELLSDEVDAPGLIEDIPIAGPVRSVQYGALLQDLREFGYSDSDPGGGPTLYVFPYDWRRSNIGTADALDAFLATRIGNAVASIDLTIVAHSMGGLIARYFLESGRYDGRPGWRATRRLITLATPHRGAPKALLTVRGEAKAAFLNADQTRALASDRRFPSAYQLLPAQGEPFAWNRDPRTRYDSLDIYDAHTRSELALVQENMEAAMQFQDGLSLSRRPAHTRYFCFSGSQQTTTNACWIARADGRPTRVLRNEMEDAGDGTVPVWSSVLVGIQSQHTGGEHGTIYKDDSLRRTLARLLGAEVLLAGEVPAIQIALRDPVVRPGEPIHAAVSFPAGTATITGSVTIESVGSDGIYRPVGESLAILYQGVRMEKLAINFPAPLEPGAYRIRYQSAGQPPDSSAADMLFVQLDSSGPVRTGL